MDKPHKRLLAWQKSMDLVVEVYELSKSFPREERFGLTSQVRRASISVPSNIAGELLDVQSRNSETSCRLLWDR